VVRIYWKGRFWAWSERVKEWWMMSVGMITKRSWQVNEEVNRDRTDEMMMMMMKWIWKLISKPRWCISEWAICDFQWGDGWWARKGDTDNRWAEGWLNHSMMFVAIITMMENRHETVWIDKQRLWDRSALQWGTERGEVCLRASLVFTIDYLLYRSEWRTRQPQSSSYSATRQICWTFSTY